MKKISLILATVLLSGAVLASCNGGDGENQTSAETKAPLDERYETQYENAAFDAKEEGNDLYAILRMDMDLIAERYNMTSAGNGVYTIESPAVTVKASWDGQSKGVKPTSIETTDGSVVCYPGIKCGMSAGDAKSACDKLAVANVNTAEKVIRMSYSIDDYTVNIYINADEATVNKINPTPDVEDSYNIEAEKEYNSNPTGTVSKIVVSIPQRPF